MAVRGLGCPVAFHLTGGHRGDVRQAATLIDGHEAELVLANAAYDADHFRVVIAAMDALAVIPNNWSCIAKHPFDRQLYKERHLVDCRFSKRKQFRRVATGYEKTARNYLVVVTIAATILWLKYASTGPRGRVPFSVSALTRWSTPPARGTRTR
jgi:transposase